MGIHSTLSLSLSLFLSLFSLSSLLLSSNVRVFHLRYVELDDSQEDDEEEAPQRNVGENPFFEPRHSWDGDAAVGAVVEGNILKGGRKEV
jgi:hypothetical protein